MHKLCQIWDQNCAKNGAKTVPVSQAPNFGTFLLHTDLCAKYVLPAQEVCTIGNLPVRLKSCTSTYNLQLGTFWSLLNDKYIPTQIVSNPSHWTFTLQYLLSIILHCATTHLPDVHCVSMYHRITTIHEKLKVREAELRARYNITLKWARSGETSPDTLFTLLQEFYTGYVLSTDSLVETMEEYTAG